MKRGQPKESPLGIMEKEMHPARGTLGDDWSGWAGRFIGFFLSPLAISAERPGVDKPLRDSRDGL